MKVRRGGEAYRGCLGWVSAATFSRDGASLAVRYRVGRCRDPRAAPPLSFVYTVDVSGRNLWRWVPAPVLLPTPVPRHVSPSSSPIRPCLGASATLACASL